MTVETTLLTLSALAFAVISLTIAWMRTRELQRVTDRLHALYRVSQFIVSSLDPEEVASHVVNATREIMGYSHVAVLRVEDDVLVPLASAGYAQPLLELPVSSGITGRVARTGKAAFVANVSRDPDFVAAVAGTTSEVACPIIVNDAIMGVFDVETVGGRRLTHEDAQLIGNLAGQLSLAYTNALRHQEARARAMRDSLTGLLDHAAFVQQLEAAVARALRDGKPVAVAVADLDDFRAYNDVYGHVEGDAALRQCADTIRATIRDHDVAARYGGEEFAVILTGATRDGARAAAERIRARLAQGAAPFGGAGQHLTVSFGVAAVPEDAGDAVNLLSRADEALYMAKHSGKNCVRVPVVILGESQA
ncbi:MAG TPA: sensor domain-containing diguanylate cyclase [bacterium]|jgi:diguanylate cyclase (GGDEF)-like protein|nr:sensor domain-containing diguanylate cyclase [bacterium]